MTCWASEFRRSALTLEGPALPAEPLPAEPSEFWSNPLTVLRDEDHAGPAVIPDMAGALPQQLGRFPLWQGNHELLPALQDIYHARLASGSRDANGSIAIAR